jgi:hypothetical protein
VDNFCTFEKTGVFKIMSINLDKIIASQLAKTLTAMCVRHTLIEEIRAGKSPITRTGDYSDVKVIDAEGQEIPWNEVSRISDDEMKILMKSIVNRLYTFFIQEEDPRFIKQVNYFTAVADKWDAPEPEIDLHLDCTKKIVD